MIIDVLGSMLAFLLGIYYFFVLLIANDIVTVIKAATVLILIVLIIRYHFADVGKMVLLLLF